MNRLLVIILATIYAVVYAQERYTDKYDNVNLQEILGNERLFKKYLDCLLDDNDRSCTTDGKELRRAIPDALTSECSRCTDKQKHGAVTVIKHLRDHRPGDWQRLRSKWDPQGLYLQKYAGKLTA